MQMLVSTHITNGINNCILYLYTVSTTQINRIGPVVPVSMVTSAMLPFTTSMSRMTPTSVALVLNLISVNPILASTLPTPTHTLYGTPSSHNNRSSTTFQATTAQPNDVFSEVNSSRLDTVGIVAIAIASVLFLTVLILITTIFIILLKKQEKSKDKEKCHDNNLSMGNHSNIHSKPYHMLFFFLCIDNSVYEQPTDSHDGPITECHRVPPVTLVPQIILSAKPQLIDKYGYHVTEPSIPNFSGGVQRTEGVHYEQVYTWLIIVRVLLKHTFDVNRQQLRFFTSMRMQCIHLVLMSHYA